MSTSNEAHNSQAKRDPRDCSDERTFRKRIDALEDIFTFMEIFSEKAGINADTRHALQLAVEELFTNMVKYSRESNHEVLIGLARSGATVHVCLTDYNVQPFDPTKAPEPDVTLPPEQRQPGGLGLFLTKKLIENIHYEHRNGNNIITLTKFLE